MKCGLIMILKGMIKNAIKIVFFFFFKNYPRPLKTGFFCVALAVWELAL